MEIIDVLDMFHILFLFFPIQFLSLACLQDKFLPFCS